MTDQPGLTPLLTQHPLIGHKGGEKKAQFHLHLSIFSLFYLFSKKTGRRRSSEWKEEADKTPEGVEISKYATEKGKKKFGLHLPQRKQVRVDVIRSQGLEKGRMR